MKLLTFALITIFLCGCSDTKNGLIRTSDDGQSQIIMAKEGDARIEAATKEARRKLPEFLKALQNPKQVESAMVKIPVTDGKTREFMWITEVRYDKGTFTGAFVDDALDIEGPYKKGLPGTCRAEDISDWIYADNDKPVGGFTVKVLEEMAAQNPKNR